MRWQPTMHTNHIAWLVWHMARVEDSWVSRLQQGSNQVWTAEGWAGRFHMDPEGNFLFAAGSESNRLASYRVDGDTGTLTPLETYSVGKRPMGVLMTSIGG